MATNHEVGGSSPPGQDNLSSYHAQRFDGANMKQKFSATVWQEDGLYVAQCLDLDVASQGETETEALANLKEALELHFEHPTATSVPKVKTIEIEISAA